MKSDSRGFLKELAIFVLLFCLMLLWLKAFPQHDPPFVEPSEQFGG